jgi:hypothetical protein
MLDNAASEQSLKTATAPSGQGRQPTVRQEESLIEVAVNSRRFTDPKVSSRVRPLASARDGSLQCPTWFAAAVG